MKELLKTGKFAGLYFLVVCHMVYGYYMSNQFKQYGFTGGIDDKTLTLIGSCGALFNGCFKVFWASLLDCFNFKQVYAVVVGIQIAMLIAVHWAVYNAYSYFIVICLSFMCDGSITSMVPVVTNRIFGTARGPSVWGYLFSTFGVAAMSGTLFVATAQSKLGYNGMLLICLALTLVAATINFFYEYKKIDYIKLANKIGFNYKDDINDDKIADVEKRQQYEDLDTPTIVNT